MLINFAILSPDGFIASLLHLGTLFPNLAEASTISELAMTIGNDKIKASRMAETCI